MATKTIYSTKQRRTILDFLQSNADKQVSAAQIASAVCSQSEIGKSTVYRQLDKLLDEGIIKRFKGKDGRSVLYQYISIDKHCNEHFHMKCVICGKIFHLDECLHIDNFRKHIFDEHKFNIDIQATIFYGNCSDCSEGVQK